MKAGDLVVITSTGLQGILISCREVSGTTWGDQPWAEKCWDVLVNGKVEKLYEADMTQVHEVVSENR